MLIGIPLVAILIPAVLTWAKDLNPSAWRVRQLDEQSKLICFWESWIKAVSSTLPNESHKDDTGEVITLLREARIEQLKAGKNVLSLYRANELRDYREFKLSFTEFQQYRAGLSWLRRAFLLYKSPNPRAKFAKLSFYWNVLSPFVIFPIELSLLKHTQLGQYPAPTLLTSWLASSRGNAAVFLILLIGLAIGYWIFSSIFLRSRSIRFENDRTMYVDRLRGRASVHLPHQDLGE
jgi:hypothetical protein